MKNLKRFAFVILALVIAGVAFARPYKYAVGLSTGAFGIGITEKTLFTDHVFMSEDLGYRRKYAAGDLEQFDEFSTYIQCGYQNKITEGEGIDLHWFVGGGVSLGGIYRFRYGKFGINALAGIEADMKNAPISFAVDFRPGYALGFGDGTAHAFDWTIGVSIFYTLPK